MITVEFLMSHKKDLFMSLSLEFIVQFFASDLTGSSTAAITGTVTTKLLAANDQTANQINPLAVKLGGASSSAFGEGLVTSPDPQIEAYLSSAGDAREWETFSGQNDGYVNVGTGLAELSIGSTLLAYSTLRTKDFLPYVPGQGAVYRFTAAFNSGVANSLQLVGPYHAEDGLAIGYNGTGFGVMHRYGRKLEVQKLSFSSQSTVAGDVTITLNGTPNTVRLDALGNIWSDARSVSTGVYSENGPLGLSYEWQAYQISGDAYFMRTTHGALTGSMAFDPGSTNASASFSQFQSGAEGTQDWYYQTGFSYDALDGSGPSAMTLDPQKINVYEFKYGWLGVLPIKISVANEQCQEMIPVHVIPWTNLNTIPHLEDPRFPISYALASAGSVTPMSLRGASVYGAIEGQTSLKHKQFSVINEETADTTEDPILCVMASRINLSQSNINRRRIFVKEINITNESSTKAATIKVYVGSRNNLVGSNFFNDGNLDSIVLIDKSASALVNDSLELVASRGVAPTAGVTLDIDKFLLPKQVLIVTTQTSSSTAPIIVSLNGNEDV